MTDVVIDTSQYYGQPSISNGRIIAFAVSPTQWTVAVAYQDGHVVVVPLPELRCLMDEASGSVDRLVSKMAQRLGMVGHTIDFTAAAGVISLASMIVDALSNDGQPMPGRGTLQLIGTAA